MRGSKVWLRDWTGVATLALMALPVLWACGEEQEGSGLSCESSEDCPTGERCEEKVCICEEAGCATVDARFGFTGDDDVKLVSLGELEVTSAGGAEVRVPVPDGAESVAVVLDGAGSNLVLAERITTPGGEDVYRYGEVTTNRTDVVDGLYTVLIPSNPDVELEGGEWRLAYLSGGGAFTGEVTAVIKEGGASSKALDINLYFVGVEGLTAETAPDDAGFQAILSGVESIYGSAGISFGSVSYRDVTGEDADRLGAVDSIDGPSSELAQLFALSEGQTNRAINFFFVSDIAAGDAGFTIVGLSGGVPGPPALHGTGRSGVAVNLADFIAARGAGDEAMLEEASRLTEIIMAHEAGHYLGLYHTTERNGAALNPDGIVGSDPIGDTSVCPDSADANSNKALSADECADADGGNLMFWSPKADSRTLSSQQGQVLVSNPLVR